MIYFPQENDTENQCDAKMNFLKVTKKDSNSNHQNIEEKQYKSENQE